MKIKFFSLMFIFLAAIQIACGQATTSNINQSITSENNEIKIQNLKNQATEMYKALFEDKDFEKIADLTHPKIIDKVGNRENFIEGMKKVKLSANDTFKTLTWSIGNPRDLVEIDKQLFGIVPRTLDGTTFQGNNVVQKGCAVGISNDDGSNWKFVNCPNFNDLFPELADKLKIPEQKTFSNGVEQ